jgi:LL-diaminopimelate aminotransferase
MGFTAKRMKGISTHFFTEHQKRVSRMKAEGIDVIDLDIGSPDLPPPKEVIDVLAQSAHDPSAHGYQPHIGTTALREAWASMYRRDFGVELDPAGQVLPLLGSKEGIFHLTQALVDPGDVVLLPDPGYPTYLKSTLFAGGVPYFLPLTLENDFLPDLDSIPVKVARKAKLIWINYPNNPTAGTAPLSFYRELVAFARKYQILICHDAAYSQIYFGDPRPPSLLQVPGAAEIGVEFNSLSKSHNMAGWRVAAAVGNEQALHALLTLKTNTDSGHFLPVMQAAAAAMTGEQGWRAVRNDRYRARLDLVFDRLQALGLETRKPEATFYLWVKTPKGQTSVQFADRLLEECRISVAPGVVFGEGGEGYIRFSLVQPLERLTKAVERLSRLSL